MSPDPDAPLEEAIEALNGLVAKGKARHVACSNYSADQMRQAEGIATGTGASHLLANQVEWNLLNRAIEADIVPAAHEVGMSIIPFFPLASGMLTGKYTMRRPFPTGSRLASAPYFATLATEENFEYVEKLSAFAQAHGHSILELAIAWLCAQESVPSVIIGAMNPEQVRSNVAAAEWKLDDDVSCGAAFAPLKVCGSTPFADLTTEQPDRKQTARALVARFRNPMLDFQPVSRVDRIRSAGSRNDRTSTSPPSVCE